MSFRAIKSFSRALHTYDQEARVQKLMAEKLLDLLISRQGKEFDRILEMGCGTGFLTRQILSRLSYEKLTLNDRVEKVREKIKAFNPDAHFLCGDAETLDFPSGQNLILSSAVFQWFTHLQNFFKKAYNLLAPGGILAFAAFGPENFWEIKAASGRGLSYPSPEQLLEWLNPGFQPLCLEESLEPLRFKTPLKALQHIRRTGVGGVSEKVLNPEELKGVMTRYENLFLDQKAVTLTYHPLWVIAQRREAWQ